MSRIPSSVNAGTILVALFVSIYLSSHLTHAYGPSLVTHITPQSTLFGNVQHTDGSFQRMCSKGGSSRQADRTSLSARYRSYYEADDEDESGFQRSLASDRPTATLVQFNGPPVSPAKPKIVVLGASGKVGRLVVKQLLDMNGDMTIVAMVRNYDKAIKVLSDDLLISGKRGGPKLQIVQGDLVPPEELPGYSSYDVDEEEDWKERAESASAFYGKKIQEFDNREMMPDVNEALEDAIKDCTTIISCVGSIRPTNIWTDFMARPFLRILRKDVSDWCKDGRHPFYTQYASTRKALGIAEREQLKREAAAAVIAEDLDLEVDEYKVPKMRFIRISDLSVSHEPWGLVPLVTNILQSLTIRYHEMAEQLLEQSSILETVVLRVGDLVDEERNVNTTSIQLCHSGSVPQPAIIGREDVARLATASAMFRSFNETLLDQFEPCHYTFGVRWVGKDLHPYPAQGQKSDGLPEPKAALTRSLRTIRKEHMQNRRRDTLLRRRRKLIEAAREDDEYDGYFSDVMIRLRHNAQVKKRQLKPHGICAAIPVYIILAFFAKALLQPLLPYVPGYQTYMAPVIGRFWDRVFVGTAYLLRHAMQHLPNFARRRLHHISI